MLVPAVATIPISIPRSKQDAPGPEEVEVTVVMIDPAPRGALQLFGLCV